MTSTAAPTRFTYSAADGLEVVAYRWDTAGPVRGIVQLTHGMGEHVLRYAPFAAELNRAGFVVYGQDHRGHGATAGAPENFGDLGAGGWPGLLDDIERLRVHAVDEHPGVPLVLFAHSMGSFAAQQYLLAHSGDVTGVVLTGTAAIDPLAEAVEQGGDVDLSMFNAPFAPARTDFDWLSRDESQVDAYVADDFCGFGLNQAAAAQMFAGAREVADEAKLAGVRKDLPLYIAVGEADPVNGQLQLVNLLVQRYEAAGLADVTLTTYPDARHEILNETNADEVVAGILAWLDRVVPS